MNISTVRVQNYRSIRDEALDCSSLTALVGRNGAGKSAYLHAIDLFYSTSDHVSITDFYNDDHTNDIVITVTFTDLSDDAKELFESRIEGEMLSVAKVISWNDGSPKVFCHGSTLQNPDFSPLRASMELTDRAATAKAELKKLSESGKYDDLPEWSTKVSTLEALKEWELNNQENCVRMRDDGQFFGFRQVGQGYLGRFTRCLFIPAVRDAAGDAIEGRGSVFTDLLDLVVRSALAKMPEVDDLKESMQSQYEAILNPENLPHLGALASQISSTLQAFVPSSEILLNWLPLDDLDVPMPKANMRIVEDGYPAPLENCGHGLQRAFVFTMLQHLAMAQLSPKNENEDEEQDERGETMEHEPFLPNLVLLIEEPELYQHPTRQRHFARILLELSQGETLGVADQTQVIYSTHSPHFVGLDRIESIRLLRKAEISGELPKETKVVRVSLNTIAEEIWNAAGQPGEKFTGETLAPRLTSIMTPWMSEGFFADVAVIVEGEDDRAAVIGMAIQMDFDFDSVGISVIPCGGKNNIDRPAAIFRSLGIPTYAIWDSDKTNNNPNPAPNHLLLKLFGQEPEDWPSGAYGEYACFQDKLETMMENELGDAYERLILECQQDFGISCKQDAIKNPNVVAEVISRAGKEGRTCTTLEAIVKSIVALNN